MHRFFANFHLSETVLISQDQSIFHQISRVFRARKGDLMVFFEAHGYDYVYELIDIDRKSLKFLKKQEIVPISEICKTPLVILFQAYPNKVSTLEVLVQKVVEIGAQKIVFFPAEHSQIQSIPANKITRLSIIAQEAMEQSHGNCPLVIEQIESLQEAFEKYSGISHILAHPNGEKMIKKSLQPEVGLWVGPEGGWSPKEEAFFKSEKYTFWSFNKNVLRLETAAIVGLGILYSENSL